jgi:demethylspheroidene O-methyltransferase
VNPGPGGVIPDPFDAPAQAGGGSRLFDWWQSSRDRLLASPGFQRWAARLPIARVIARRRARQLFDLMAGFVYSQVLLAAIRLRLFELLANGPMTPGQLSARTGLDSDPMLRLLAALVSLRLLEHRSAGRVGLGPLGAPLVGNEALAAMAEHHVTLYADLADPVALLRAAGAGASLNEYFPYAGAGTPSALQADRVAAYSALMAASNPLVAGEVLDAYPFSRHRCLLDVGGGEGVFVTRVAQRYPELRLKLFDLPAVAERARARIAASGVDPARIDVQGGDFLADALPRGADVITLLRVVHDHNDDRVLTLLRAIREALEPGGVLVLAEQMSGVPGAEPMGDAYFGMYLLAMGAGRPRTPAQLGSLLAQAGFERVKRLSTRMPLQAGLLVAETPR